MRETVAPILRITDIDRAVAWYARLGFRKVGEHRFEPDAPAYVFVARGDVWFHLSQHEGDARPDSLVYVFVDDDLDAIAAEFGTHVHDNDWGRDLKIRDPDGNRLRIGGAPDDDADGRVSIDAVARELSPLRSRRVTWSRSTTPSYASRGSSGSSRGTTTTRTSSSCVGTVRSVSRSKGGTPSNSAQATSSSCPPVSSIDPSPTMSHTR